MAQSNWPDAATMQLGGVPESDCAALGAYLSDTTVAEAGAALEAHTALPGRAVRIYAHTPDGRLLYQTVDKHPRPAEVFPVHHLGDVARYSGGFRLRLAHGKHVGRVLTLVLLDSLPHDGGAADTAPRDPSPVARDEREPTPGEATPHVS
jgi:hypothetical protein